MWLNISPRMSYIVCWPNTLHDANLDVLGEEGERQHGQKKQAKPADARPCRCFPGSRIQRGNKVTIDCLSKDQRRASSSGVTNATRTSASTRAICTASCIAEAAASSRIIRFAEGLFFVQVAHARSSSSSSNCF